MILYIYVYICIGNKDLKLNQNYHMLSFIIGNYKKKLLCPSKTRHLKSKDLPAPYEMPGLGQGLKLEPQFSSM